MGAGDDFRTKAGKYLTDALSKGVPSIFADVKALYSDPSKRATIGELVESYRKSLEATETFGLPITDDSSEGTFLTFSHLSNSLTTWPHRNGRVVRGVPLDALLPRPAPVRALRARRRARARRTRDGAHAVAPRAFDAQGAHPQARGRR